MTFNQIQLDIFRRLNYADAPATPVTNRINSFINQRHRQILAQPGMELLRDGPTPLTFASVASQKTYALGPNIARIKDIYDGTTNQMKLTERSLQWVNTMDPRSTQTGTPESWVPLGFGQVQSQPAAACDLHVISTAASDGASVTCYVEYTRTGGYVGSASHTMNGITDVALTAVGDVVTVDKLYISAAAVGTVTLLDGLAGNTLATIPIGQEYGRFIWIRLWPTPSSVWTYQVDFTRAIADMSNPTDEPLLPPDFHYLLSLGARIDEYEKMDDDRRMPLLRDWKMGIDQLKNFVINNQDYIIVPGGTPRNVGSNLGSGYPEGRW